MAAKKNGSGSKIEVDDGISAAADEIVLPMEVVAEIALLTWRYAPGDVAWNPVGASFGGVTVAGVHYGISFQGNDNTVVVSRTIGQFTGSPERLDDVKIPLQKIRNVFVRL